MFPMKKTLTKRTITEANVNPTRNTVNHLKLNEDKKPIKKIEKNNKEVNKSQDISNSNLKKKMKTSKSVPKMGKNNVKDKKKKEDIKDNKKRSSVVEKKELKKEEKKFNKTPEKKTEDKKVEEEQPIVKKCPACETGNLIKKRGKYGYFLGCTNYPQCNHMEKIIKRRRS